MIEILGNKCIICPEKHEKLLTIRYIRDDKENNLKYVKKLAEEAIMRGENPNIDFRVLCYNCNIHMNKLKKFLKSTGLTELSQEKLEQGLRTIYN